MQPRAIEENNADIMAMHTNQEQGLLADSRCLPDAASHLMIASIRSAESSRTTQNNIPTQPHAYTMPRAKVEMQS